MLGFSFLLPEEDITNEKLLETVRPVYQQRDVYKQTMAAGNQNQAIDIIINLIEDLSKKS